MQKFGVCAGICFRGVHVFRNDSVRWDAPLKNQKTKEICMMVGNKVSGPKCECIFLVVVVVCVCIAPKGGVHVSYFCQTNLFGGMHH